MNKLTITILKEDILLDNYLDKHNCPITKALQRVGKTGWVENGGNIRDENYVIVMDYDNQSFRDLRTKLFDMYGSFSDTFKHHKDTATPVESFEHTLEWK